MIHLKEKPKSKDRWDKLTACSGLLTFLSALVIASVGWWISDVYKKREHKLAELEVTAKMIPFLKTGDRETRAALIAMASLGMAELATKFATLYGGEDAVAATLSIAKNGTAADAKDAAQALDKISRTGAPLDAVAAAAALRTIGAPTSASPPRAASTEQVAVVTSGQKQSGAGKGFNSPPYELCAEAPPGYVIKEVDFRPVGDRSCGAWSECKEVSRTDQRSCWQFSMQGHDERAPPGQGISEGVLRLVTKLNR